MGAFCKPPNWRAYLRDDPVEQAALQWWEIVRYVLGRRDALADGDARRSHYFEYRYEDLCLDTRGVLGEVFAFAGLCRDPEVLARLPERQPSQNFKWQQALCPAQIETAVGIQRPLLLQLGYDL